MRGRSALQPPRSAWRRRTRSSRWRSTRARRSSRPRSRAVPLARHRRVDALEEPAEPPGRVERDELNAIAVQHRLDLLSWREPESLPDGLRDHYLKLGRDRHRLHGRAPSITMRYDEDDIDP